MREKKQVQVRVLVRYGHSTGYVHQPIAGTGTCTVLIHNVVASSYLVRAAAGREADLLVLPASLVLRHVAIAGCSLRRRPLAPANV